VKAEGKNEVERTRRSTQREKQAEEEREKITKE
jgi:hypothetical protein